MISLTGLLCVCVLALKGLPSGINHNVSSLQNILIKLNFQLITEITFSMDLFFHVSRRMSVVIFIFLFLFLYTAFSIFISKYRQ